MVTRHDEFLRLHFHCLMCFFSALFHNSNFPLIMALTEKQKTELLQGACAAIEEIKKEVKEDVIKDYMIPPLVRIKTGELVGFSVIMQLSGRYTYNEETLKDWKHKLKADDWHISVSHNRLSLTFKVRYKEV